ncbi:tetratricopeptide repeat protein [Pseudomonas sp. UMAB-40]|uniref:tetratricopeptide repeat protein n=1 Tax=Pseudomonas sp. UMAB-40 TaxID=1365407 RepID=UPI001C55C1C5|nr:SEL1-like repeat protein [Pseudomonas sp. UMAB-40]
MEGVVVVGVFKIIRIFSVFIAILFVNSVYASQSGDLLVAMEAGKCVPQAEQLHKMALAGDALSQLAFGQAANKNLCRVVELGKEFSFYWYRKSAEQGNSIAQAALGTYLATSGIRKDEEESLIWYQRAADQDNADGKFGLAQLYGRHRAWSKIIPHNNELALKLYHEAASQDHELSYFVLSQIYDKGSNGVEKDDAVAAYWYRKSADSGSAFAQGQLAKMFQEGRGVDQSNEEARRWYGKSAALGNTYAQTSLAKMYRDGSGGIKDEGKALQLFLKSAEEGESNAQFELGRIYLLGLSGVPQNRSKAEYWFAKSAEKWHSLAIKELESFR